MKTQETEKKKKKGIEKVLYVMLLAWSILLVLLIIIFALKLQGYDSFWEWRKAVEQENTGEVSPTPGALSPTPDITQEPTPHITVSPTPTPTPTLTPTPTPYSAWNAWDSANLQEYTRSLCKETVKEYGEQQQSYTLGEKRLTMLTLPHTGVEELDTAIEEIAKAAAEETVEWLSRTEQSADVTKTVLAVDYDCYRNGEFLSIVFYTAGDIVSATEDVLQSLKEEKRRSMLPVVLRMDTAQVVYGQDIFKETYFAIIRERLMEKIKPYLALEEGMEEPFLTYEEPYHAEDYTYFYFKGDEVVFYFPENVLTETASHREFTYEAALSEAQAFMKYDLSGNSTAREIRELDPKAKMIAFTFDDGAYQPVEQRLLEAFQKAEGRATFFTLGSRVTEHKSYTEILKKLYEAGHEMASHTYSHKNLAKESKQVFWEEINKTNLILGETLGYAPDYVRLPYGSHPKWSNETPMPLIDWSLDTIDYSTRNADAIYKAVMKNIKDGDIILMHSLYPSTAEAVEKLLPELSAQGYQFVTISELFHYKEITLENGKKYRKGY